MNRGQKPKLSPTQKARNRLEAKAKRERRAVRQGGHLTRGQPPIDIVECLLDGERVEYIGAMFAKSFEHARELAVESIMEEATFYGDPEKIEARAVIHFNSGIPNEQRQAYLAQFRVDAALKLAEEQEQAKVNATLADTDKALAEELGVGVEEDTTALEGAGDESDGDGAEGD